VRRAHAIACGLASLLALAPTHAFAECKLQKFGELQVTMAGGRPLVDGSINGVDARFFVDSGAFFSTLSKQRLGPYQLHLEPVAFGAVVSGLGGSEAPMLTYAKDFTLQGFGGQTLHKIAFLVTATPMGPDAIGLLGQNILSIFDTEYDLGNGVIRLIRPKDCGKQLLAYWHGDASVAEITIEGVTRESPHLIGKALLNGTKIDVLFDTGSPRSLLTAKAAAHAGVTRSSVDTTDAGSLGGMGGSRRFETWIARFDKVDFGGEVIKNTRLRVGDFDLPFHGDLILGVDFFLSHRIYVAASQRKIYFTYNGGRVFDLSVVHETPETPAPASGEPAAASAATATAAVSPDTPKDAAGYRRRGAAHAARLNFPAALADLDQAVKMDPADAQNYYSRALARGQNGQLDLAMADLNEALRIKPNDVPILTARGELHLVGKDEAAARTDFDAALRLSPTDSDVAYRIAEAYTNTDYFREAIPQLDKWIAANRRNDQLAFALNLRCWCRATLNVELDLALADCNAALRKASGNPSILDSRALVWLRRGDFDKSIADYQEALRQRPGQPDSRYGLGLAQLRKGLKEQGQKDIDAAIALDPQVAQEFKRYGLAP